MKGAKRADLPVWIDIVQDYTLTELSRESDRLPALAGIAERFAKVQGWKTYLAGLFLEDEAFLALLSWRADKGHSRTRVQPCQLPSWSWASVSGPISTSCPPFRGKWAVELLSYQLISGPHPFGAPQQASVVLQGPCGLCTLCYIPGSVPDTPWPHVRAWDLTVPVSPDYSFMVRGENYMESVTELVMLLLIPAKPEVLRFTRLQGLLLQPVDQSPNCYKRVGFFSAYEVDFEPGDKLETRQLTLV